MTKTKATVPRRPTHCPDYSELHMCMELLIVAAEEVLANLDDAEEDEWDDIKQLKKSVAFAKQVMEGESK